MDDKKIITKKRKLLSIALIIWIPTVMATAVVANFVAGAVPYCLAILAVLFIAMVIFTAKVLSMGNK